MILYQEPGLIGLELWRGISHGASLYQLRQHKRQYFEALRDFLLEIHCGQAQSPDPQETHALRQASGFSHAILCGGEALHPALAPILHAAPLPFSFSINAAGAHAARPGALRIFDSLHWRHGLALDLGQCQLKLIASDLQLTLPRDTEALPFGAHALDAETSRHRLRAWISEALLLAPRTPDGIVLALPVAIDPDGTAQSATYPGLYGPLAPIFDGLFPCPYVVLNDAVLSAAGFKPPTRRKTLVVTLGFGIGGALWDT